jgi:hypothetical protein
MAKRFRVIRVETILGDIRKSRCTTGINETGGKFATGVNDTGGKIAARVNYIGGKFVTGMLTPATNFANGTTGFVLFCKFATGVNDTGSKFAFLF